MKILLAVDQATGTSGYALYKDGELVKHGKVDFDGESIERIAYMKKWLSDMLDAVVFQYANADKNFELEVILEDIQYQPNYEKKSTGAIASVTTFKTLAWLQGTLLVMCHERNIKTKTYFSTEWKSTFGIKGVGRTEQKRAAQAYVKDVLGIKATQDECDAILLGKHAIEEDGKYLNWG